MSGIKPQHASDQQDYTLKAILILARRCWPYYQPMVKHLIAWVSLSAVAGAIFLGSVFVGNDIVENKILLGNKLQSLQATMFLLDDSYVKTSEDDETLLSNEQRRDIRIGLIVWGIVLVILFLLASAVIIYYMVWIFQQINQQLRVEMLNQAEHLSLKFHNQSRTGDAIYRVYQDSASITRVLQFLLVSPTRIIGWVGFSIIILLFFSPWFALIILGAAAPIVLLLKTLIPKIRNAARRSRELNSDLTSHIQESLAAIRVIKACNAEERMMTNFERDSQAALYAAYEMRYYIALLSMGVAISGFTALLIAEYFMAAWAMTEKATYLGATIALVGFATWNLGAFKSASSRGKDSSMQTMELAFIWAIIQDILVGLKRAFFLLELEPEVRDPYAPKSFPDPIETVTFDNIHFGYEPGNNILQSVNLTARTGTITAIVGGSGSGKSTLMSLLLRLYDPEQGNILVNGTDLTALAVDNLRSKVAIALQQNVLFAMSVVDNIRYGQDDIATSEVIEAARIACADDFIKSMPEGYDTELGERGGKLSTGQRQRLSIARAVLRDTPILVLDEPTASLDAETERQVIENLSRWGQDKVVFIITHRLSTIRHADQIALLKDGVIRELGSHEELIRSGGAYHRFVMAELGPA